MNQLQVHYLESVRVPTAPVDVRRATHPRATARELAGCMRRRDDRNP